MKYKICGGNALHGELRVNGAKNCVLPMLACCVLTDETVTIDNCPKVQDVLDMADILSSIGAEVSWQGDSISVTCKNVDGNLCCEKVGKIRASLFMLGPLFARNGFVSACLPGGCAIGKRPIDIHIDGLKRLGAEVTWENGVCCSGKVHGNDVYMRFPSVGATENLLMCASLSDETTVLYNCACEPEITALEKMLVSMGAEIQGIGTSVVTVKGGKLHGTRVSAIPDRIVAATYILSAVCAGGDVWVTNCNPRHFSVLNNMLKDTVDCYNVYGDAVHVVKKKRHCAVGMVRTAVYPGFATDMQPLLVASQCTAFGKTVVEETLFENRLSNAVPLQMMGADILCRSDKIVINGVPALSACTVGATDLRGGAALVLAMLGAQGTGYVTDIHHIQRGYCELEKSLRQVGADITIVD